MTENEVSRVIVDSAFKIHTTLGRCLYESVYEAILAHELQRRGCRVVRQRGIPVVYEQVHLNLGFRADIIVDREVIIEVKSIESLAPRSCKAAANVFKTDGLATWIVDKLQRRPYKGRYKTRRE